MAGGPIRRRAEPRRSHPLAGFHFRNGNTTPIRKGGSTGIVGSFGMTRDGGLKMHRRVDLLSVVGGPVYAMHDGTIYRGGWENRHVRHQGYGLRVYVVDETNDIHSRYAHLLELTVDNGDTVAAGQQIAVVGRTGNIMTNDDIPTHIHVEFRTGAGYGPDTTPIDPLSWLEYMS